MGRISRATRLMVQKIKEYSNLRRLTPIWGRQVSLLAKPMEIKIQA